MNHLTADEALVERLAGVMEPVEIRDSSGKVLGRYTPVFADEKDAQERPATCFDLTAAEHALADDSKGSSLAEVWERIRAKPTNPVTKL